MALWQLAIDGERRLARGPASDGGAISHSVTAPSIANTYTATFATQYLLTTAVGIGGTAAGSIRGAIDG